jgi:hypothetical protein
MEITVRNSKSAKAVIYAYEKGYRVDTYGNVISPRGNVRKLSKKGREGCKYYRFTVCTPWDRRHSTDVFVHQLVAYQKYGDKAFCDGNVVRHLDGNSLNNESANITIGSRSDNMLDVPTEKREKNATIAGRSGSQLTPEDIKEIRRLREQENLRYEDILEVYPITKSSLSYICNYITWKNI